MKLLFLLISALVLGITQSQDPLHPPYLVSIQEVWYEFGMAHDHTCSGAIISPFYILTSGACIHTVRPRPPTPEYVVVAGTATLDGQNNRQEVGSDISKQYPYPDFDKYAQFSPDNIAIFQLESPLIFNEYVQPIRLPKKGEVPIGDAVISGWGPNSNISRSAVVPIIDYSECAKDLDQIADGGSQLLSNVTNFCSGPLDGTTGSCFFDRGSPLVQDGVLVGITSWRPNELGGKCGLSGLPSIYTEVSEYIDFIEGYAVGLTWPTCDCQK